MRLEEDINEINSYLAKELSPYLINKNIIDIENVLKRLMQIYVRELENMHKNLFKLYQIKKLPFQIYHYHYIACVIGAKFQRHGTIGTSYGFVDNYKQFTAVNSKLRRLGYTGTKSPIQNKNGRYSIIGKCAEIKAAYQLNSKSKISQLRDIEFTNAYRPRTFQIIERCATCQFVFGNV